MESSLYQSGGQPPTAGVVGGNVIGTVLSYCFLQTKACWMPHAWSFHRPSEMKWLHQYEIADSYHHTFLSGMEFKVWVLGFCP